MYCDVLYGRFKEVEVEQGIECIIDREQVLLIKEDNGFKYQLLNKSGSKYLTSSKAAKFKHVDLLIDDKHRLYKSNDSKFEETYNKVRTELKPK